MELNKIYNENCLETLKKIPDNFIDLTITSPPYNLGEKHHTGDNKFKAYDVYNDNLPENEYQENQINVLNEIYRATKEGGSIMYNHKNRIKNGLQISPYEWILKTKWNIKQEIVWYNGSQNFDKVRFYPMTERIFWLIKGNKSDFYNEFGFTDLIKDLAEGTDKIHKRAFPLTLAKRFINCFKNSNVIYDPYMGSGTTAIASIQENKNFIGSEISKSYVELSENRIKTTKMQTILNF